MFQNTLTRLMQSNNNQSNKTQMNNEARRRARRAVLAAALTLSVMGGLGLAVTAPRVTVDKVSLTLDHSASNAAAFPAEREEIADALPLLVGRDVRIASFGERVVLVWQGHMSEDNLPLAQAAVRAVLLRTGAQERGTDISRMTVTEAEALAALPGQKGLLYAATDGQEDAPDPLAALPPESLEAVRRTRFVFAHLKDVPRVASLATLAGASVRTYMRTGSDGRLRQAILGQQGWETPIRVAGEVVAILVLPLLALLLRLRPVRPRAIPVPTVVRWVGVETPDGRIQAVPSPEEGVLIGFGPGAQLLLPAGFPADTLVQVTPLEGTAARVTYHSGRGMGVGNGAAFLRRGQDAEAVDGDTLQFGPTQRVWLRVGDSEPLTRSKASAGVPFDTAARIA